MFVRDAIVIVFSIECLFAECCKIRPQGSRKPGGTFRILAISIRVDFRRHDIGMPVTRLPLPAGSCGKADRDSQT